MTEHDCVLSLTNERFQSLSGTPLAALYRVVGQGAFVFLSGAGFIDETDLRVAGVFESVAFYEAQEIQETRKGSKSERLGRNSSLH